MDKGYRDDLISYAEEQYNLSTGQTQQVINYIDENEHLFHGDYGGDTVTLDIFIQDKGWADQPVVEDPEEAQAQDMRDEPQDEAVEEPAAQEEKKTLEEQAEEIVNRLHVGYNLVPGIGVGYCSNEEDLARMKDFVRGGLAVMMTGVVALGAIQEEE